MFKIMFLENINLIILLIEVLIFTIFIVLFSKNEKLIKNISVISSFINFFISIIMWISFNQFTSKFQFLYKIEWLLEYNINLTLGIDGISLLFIVLTTFLIPFCLLTSYNVINKNIKQYYLIFLILELFLILIFSVLDLFLFYIFFETILIPMFILIGL